MNDETKDRVWKRQWNARPGFPWTDRHYLTDIPVYRAASDYPHAVCALGSQDRIPGGCFTHPKRGLLRRNAFRGPGWVRVAVFSVEFHTCLFLSMRARRRRRRFDLSTNVSFFTLYLLVSTGYFYHVQIIA
jgi:hypothetical protein